MGYLEYLEGQTGFRIYVNNCTLVFWVLLTGAGSFLQCVQIPQTWLGFSIYITITRNTLHEIHHSSLTAQNTLQHLNRRKLLKQKYHQKISTEVPSIGLLFLSRIHQDNILTNPHCQDTIIRETTYFREDTSRN